MTKDTRWYHYVLGAMLMGPLLLTLLVTMIVVGALIPNLIVGVPLAAMGVTGWWLYVPAALWAIPGVIVACWIFWEEVLPG